MLLLFVTLFAICCPHIYLSSLLLSLLHLLHIILHTLFTFCPIYPSFVMGETHLFYFVTFVVIYYHSIIYIVPTTIPRCLFDLLLTPQSSTTIHYWWCSFLTFPIWWWVVGGTILFTHLFVVVIPICYLHLTSFPLHHLLRSGTRSCCIPSRSFVVPLAICSLRYVAYDPISTTFTLLPSTFSLSPCCLLHSLLLCLFPHIYIVDPLLTPRLDLLIVVWVGVFIC